MYIHVTLSHTANVMASIVDNNKYWREFIQIYKSLPSLWKVNSDEYKNRKLKATCYNILVKKLRQIDPKADRSAVRKKVNTLRSNFRRELKKMQSSEMYGPENRYKPTLWYFNDMMFLCNQDESHTENQTMSSFTSEIEYKTKIENESSMDPFEDIDTRSESFSDTLPENSICSKNEVPQALSSPWKITSVVEKIEDEIDIQCKLWALEFRKLNSEQQMFAKKAIDDVLFEGRLSALNKNSVKINQNNC